MAAQKRRITKNDELKSEEIDLGVVELNAVQPRLHEQVQLTATTQLMSSEDAVQTATVAAPQVSVGIYKLSSTAKIPKYATSGSACFDLHCDFSGIKSVKVYTQFNIETERFVQKFSEFGDSLGIVIDAGERALVPTNLIFDIPEGWKMLIYARSGAALKQAILLANSVGVIDCDYVDPTYVIIFNQSKERQIIKQGDRVAQAELVPVFKASFNSLSEPPVQKTLRAGGFGSTGK